jgi:elongation factor 1-gamma
MSFANTELLPQLGKWFRPLIGRDPYNKKNVEDGQKATELNVKTLEDHLMINTYLVSERLTLADLFTTSIISRGFQFFFDKEWRSEHPSITRWYETVRNQEIYSSVGGKLSFIDAAIPNTPPKKEKEEKPKQAEKKEQPKKQEKKKDVEEDEEDEAPAAPKPKHPLDALPRATFVLDDWSVPHSHLSFWLVC